MWKWLLILVLLGTAILLWPDEPLQSPELPATAGQRFTATAPATTMVTTSMAKSAVVSASAAVATSCPVPTQLTTQLATLRASRQHQSEELKRLMQAAQLRPELQLQYLRELGGDIAVLRPSNRQIQDGHTLLMSQRQQLIKIATSDLAQVKLAAEQHDYRGLQEWLQQHPQLADINKLGYLEFTLLQLILQLNNCSN